MLVRFLSTKFVSTMPELCLKQETAKCGIQLSLAAKFISVSTLSQTRSTKFAEHFINTLRFQIYRIQVSKRSNHKLKRVVTRH